MRKDGTGLQAIETEYNGYWFRSRLEAKWAIYFDALDVQYEYECEGYETATGVWYLPDFYLPEYECFAEVKHLGGDFDKAHDFGAHHDILFLEGPPDRKAYRLWYWYHTDDGERSVDWMHVCICEYAIEKWGPGTFFHGEWDFDFDESIEAINAARSARFEHGEVPV